MAAIRYMVKNVDAAVAFYTDLLGFELVTQMGPPFAQVKRGDLTLWLSGPGSSAARPMPDGRKPESGGWNRLVIEVDDIESLAVRMKESGAGFRPKTVARRPGRNDHRLPLPPKQRFQSGWLGGAWHWVGAREYRHCHRAETDAGLH